MVASRWGLALAAAFTVGATLLMTTGLNDVGLLFCKQLISHSHFDLFQAYVLT